MINASERECWQAEAPRARGPDAPLVCATGHRWRPRTLRSARICERSPSPIPDSLRQHGQMTYSGRPYASKSTSPASSPQIRHAVSVLSSLLIVASAYRPTSCSGPTLQPASAPHVASRGHPQLSRATSSSARPRQPGGGWRCGSTPRTPTPIRASLRDPARRRSLVPRNSRTVGHRAPAVGDYGVPIAAAARHPR